MEFRNNSTEYTTYERALSLTMGIFLLIISLGSILANAFLLSAIYLDPYKSFRNTPIIFIANLAVADLLTGLAVDPLYAIYDFGISQNKRYSTVIIAGEYSSYVTVNNAILTIVILSIDRSVAIKKPFMYRRIMTFKTAAAIVAFSWVYSGFFSTFYLLGMSQEVYELLDTHLHVTFAFISLSFLFAFMYSNLKAEKRRNLRELTSMGNIDRATKGKLQAIKANKRILVTIFLILFVFFITFAPYAIFIHLAYYCDSCQGSKVYYFLTKTSGPIVYLNSVLNPFIYAWRHKNFRKALLWVVKCRGKRKRLNPQNETTKPDITREHGMAAF